MSTPVIGYKTTLPEFQAALKRYQLFTGKLPLDVLLRQGGQFAIYLQRRLKALAPARGSIRAGRLADLKAGRGVRVRPRILAAVAEKYGVVGGFGRYAFRREKNLKGIKGIKQTFMRGRISSGGKKVNFRALAVKAELSARESGIGFLSISARYPHTLSASEIARSRYGPALSTAKLRLDQDGGALTFTWHGGGADDLQTKIVTGLDKPAGQEAIALALRDETADMNEWVTEQMHKNAEKAGFK